MRFSDWLRGVASVAIADIDKVFDVSRAAVAAVPFLPANIKADATTLLNDAQADLKGLEGLAGSLVGEAMADGVDDVTTLLMNTASKVGSSSSPADFSKAEKAVLIQTWTAMKTQGDTLMAQFMAGIDPVKAAAAGAGQGGTAS